MLSKLDYLHAIANLVERCKRYADEIIAVYLGGSVARGDFSPGRSDIDVYVVLTEENEDVIGHVKQATETIAEEHLTDLTEVHPEPISLATTTLEKVKDGSSFLGAAVEYHSFMQTGKLLYGRDIRQLLPEPSQQAVWTSARQTLQKIYALAKQGQEHPERPYSAENPYAYFSTMFRTAHMALRLEGASASGKWEIVLVARRVYGQEHALYRILRKSFGLWEQWERNDLTEKELSKLKEDCIMFTKKLAEKYEFLGE